MLQYDLYCYHYEMCSCLTRYSQNYLWKVDLRLNCECSFIGYFLLSTATGIKQDAYLDQQRQQIQILLFAQQTTQKFLRRDETAQTFAYQLQLYYFAYWMIKTNE